ncbi:hypothetical protein HDU99_010253 [Rhizoclosmatium hyalinum]|nr:hypothetical protein HDU99_010253 [Rhizoclosmatium hyalinum]
MLGDTTSPLSYSPPTPTPTPPPLLSDPPETVHESIVTSLESLNSLPKSLESFHTSFTTSIASVAALQSHTIALKSEPCTKFNRDHLNEQASAFDKVLDSLRTSLLEQQAALLLQLEHLETTNKKLYTELMDCPFEVVQAIFSWIPPEEIIPLLTLSKSVYNCLNSRSFAKTNLVKHIEGGAAWGPVSNSIHPIWFSGNSLYSETYAREFLLGKDSIDDSDSYISVNTRIPESIGLLVNVTEVSLHSSFYVGPLPQGIGNLINVTDFSLTCSSISGGIPNVIGNLINLTYLDLDENKLTGEIPREIGNLFQLRTLTLAENCLTGELPIELFNCTQLTNLTLYSNNLTGPIPSHIGNLVQLEELNLAENDLSGDLPDTILNCELLEDCCLYGNPQLRCTIAFELWDGDDEADRTDDDSDSENDDNNDNDSVGNGSEAGPPPDAPYTVPQDINHDEDFSYALNLLFNDKTGDDEVPVNEDAEVEPSFVLAMRWAV